MQDIIALSSLRFEDETSIDSLTEDLGSILSYPFNPNQAVQNVHHLRGIRSYQRGLAKQNNKAGKTSERVCEKDRCRKRNVAKRDRGLVENKQSSTRQVRQSKHGVLRAAFAKAKLTISLNIPKSNI